MGLRKIVLGAPKVIHEVFTLLTPRDIPRDRNLKIAGVDARCIECGELIPAGSWYAVRTHGRRGARVHPHNGTACQILWPRGAGRRPEDE